MTPARTAHAVVESVEEQQAGGAHSANRAGLAVVSRAELERRHLRRRARSIFALAALFVAGALLIVAAGQAFVTAQQVHLDRLNQQLATAVAKDQNLQLARAQLESPSRILELAERQLGMVVPKSVTYLVPVDPSRSGTSARPRNAT